MANPYRSCKLIRVRVPKSEGLRARFEASRRDHGAPLPRTTDYHPKRWPESPRNAAHAPPCAANGPNHLGSPRVARAFSEEELERLKDVHAVELARVRAAKVRPTAAIPMENPYCSCKL